MVVILVVVALAAFAVWIVIAQQSKPAAQTPDAEPGAPVVDSGIPAPSDAAEMTVVDITDGDTLRLRDDSGAVENVRLVGIDTPEVYPVYECFGDEAEAELLRLAPIGSTLLVDPDVDPFDDYDRLLLYLWNGDGTFINLALVEGGFAEAIRVAPNDLHFDELLAAEDAAARANLGMWSC
ncbi:thermonuclease family protein [Pseudolysinimonas sp.]|uniref:thermonuclease family protein n=1 Tax=Pseudolysinimonas sp. TaxID=2680009 RepID=UPI00286B3B1E|nr:thermonuclease family protein [Pseudolysinimonas sp.]